MQGCVGANSRIATVDEGVSEHGRAVPQIGIKEKGRDNPMVKQRIWGFFRILRQSPSFQQMNINYIIQKITQIISETK